MREEESKVALGDMQEEGPSATSYTTGSGGCVLGGIASSLKSSALHTGSSGSHERAEALGNKDPFGILEPLGSGGLWYGQGEEDGKLAICQQGSSKRGVFPLPKPTVEQVCGTGEKVHGAFTAHCATNSPNFLSSRALQLLPLPGHTVCLSCNSPSRAGAFVCLPACL